MHTISYPRVQAVLTQLHREASSEFGKILRGLSKGLFRKLKPEDMEKTYIAISKEAGAFIYDLLIQSEAKNIVEFGTSFGISTLYLGAAAKHNNGQVITTELLPSKCEVARQHFKDAELDSYIELREGDAMETLQDAPEGIDFLLLDGWNDLYLPLLQQLEPKFKTGTLIYTDNTSFASAKPFLNYLKANPHKYRSRKGFPGAELTEYIL